VCRRMVLLAVVLCTGETFYGPETSSDPFGATSPIWLPPNREAKRLPRPVRDGGAVAQRLRGLTEGANQALCAIQPCLNLEIYVFADPSEILVDICIGKPQNHHTELLQIIRTRLIRLLILRLVVLGAIQLDHELCPRTIEIHYKSPKHCLSAKFYRMIPQIIVP